MSSSISIVVVLSRLEQTTDSHGNPVEFEIEFVKEDGQLRAMKCQNHVKHGKKSGEHDPKGNFKYNLKNKRCLLLFDVEKQQHRSVKVDSITRFNKMEVVH